LIKSGVSGFVGYQKNGNIKGFYIPYGSSYSDVGKNVLYKYMEYTIEEIEIFFRNKIAYVKEDIIKEIMSNASEILNADWKNSVFTIEEDSEFLKNGLYCEFGYVFNFDTNKLDLYRGLFDFPQSDNERKMFEIKTIFSLNYDIEPFVHHTCSISKDNIHTALKLFINWDKIKQSSLEQYPEISFLKKGNN
jgi:hypothetical protein